MKNSHDFSFNLWYECQDRSKGLINIKHSFLEIDQCLFNNPCKNQATCSYVTGSIKCFCPHGYTGINCEKSKIINSKLFVVSKRFLKSNLWWNKSMFE